MGVAGAALSAVLVAAALWLLPNTGQGRRQWLRPKKTVRRRAQTRVVDIAIAADLLALALHSGCGVLEAVESVGRRMDGTIGEHLLTVAHRYRLGMSEEDAWAGVPPAWGGVARALRLASAAGIPPAATLDQAAADLRRAEDHRIEVETARLGVRIVLPLGVTFLPAFVASTIVPVVLALGAQAIHP
ncbi:type II secretion system F family protein [Gephyromycinifex aptenodytis]|uniref:type II secretion system F family protein n=1 Tax=Gephyromycinifex aptenodytis TaxID=2716227 RepID=UPI001444DC1D|nr:type II secretion system F family protein [Gephyromycinifex aptenodytis]